MKSLRFRFATVLLTAAAVGTFTAGCSDDDDDDVFFTPTQQGQLEVYIADAPPEFDQLDAVNMTITRVEAIGLVGSGATTTTTVPLFAGSRQVNLLPLRGGQRELIGQAAVPVGTYDRIRVFFSDASVDYDINGTSQTFSSNNGNLTVAGVDATSSPGSFILDLDMPDDGVQVDAGETEQVLVDIDIDESLDLQPNATDPTSIVFTPTGRVRELADTTTGGSVRGVVRNDAGTAGNTGDDTPINNALVTLSQNGQVVAATRTDAQGAYVIDSVEAGDYQLEAQANNATTNQINVTVQAGQDTTQDVTLVDATP